MEKNTASATSLGVAGLRAAHQLIDNEPLLLRDPVILRLLGPGYADRIHSHPEDFQKPELLGLRSHVVLRSRYAEDCVAEAYIRGIRQYILLGAGLDTFAWRQPAGMPDLQIFEVDHPATQTQKLDGLSRLDIPLPPNARFVAADLETTPPRIALNDHSFDWTKPAIISWLGVMVYLSMEAIDEVLTFVASLPTTSRIVFTFTQRRQNEGPDSLSARAAAKGEPWRSFFTPAELSEKLKDFGFSRIGFLEPDEAFRLYYAGRTDALPPPRHASLCVATV